MNFQSLTRINENLLLYKNSRPRKFIARYELAIIVFKNSLQKQPPEVFYKNFRKEVFSEIFQNSQENTCVRESFLMKLQASALRQGTILKKTLWHRCFL